MAIIIERTITIKNDQATLDNPLYLYIGDGDITCLFTIKEMKKAATFGSINTTNLITENASYGEVRIYKPDEHLVSTARAEIIDDKLQAVFSFDNIDHPTEAGRHQLQIHLYDNESGSRNRLTIPPIDLHVLLPIGTDTSLIDEAMVGYSLLDAKDEDIPTFDENGNYNKTIWQKGDIITQDKLNKLEDALHQVTAADDDFVTKEALDIELVNKANTEHGHSVVDIEGLANVAMTGSYEDLRYKPDLSSFATKTELADKANYIHIHSNYATREELDGKSDKGHGHSDYALKKDINIPTKVSQLTNDKEYITTASIPSYYVTEEDLDDYKFATMNYVNGLRFATEGYVNQQILKAQFPEYDGEPSLEGLATVDMIPVYTSQLINDSKFVKISALDDYATTTYVNTTINERLENFDDFNLTDYPTKEEMDNALADKANDFHEHYQYSLTDHNHNEEYDKRYMLRGEIPDINIPTKESDLEPDRGYAKEADVNGAIENINNNLTNNYARVEDIPTVPTNVSAFTNDAGYAKETTVDKAISNIKQDLTNNYVTIANMPTKVSQLENDKGYIACEGITKIKVVEELPYEEEPGVLYIVITK